MTLPRIDPFINPYATTIKTGQEAANHICTVGPDNGLSNRINGALEDKNCYSSWERAMPSKTPENLKIYKNNYQAHNPTLVDCEINSYGSFLSPGQELFHGGLWPPGNSQVTTRPLSTTFCPTVAFQNALYKGKAYDANRIDLMVLTVKSSVTNAFAYKRKNMSLGHENEVLFASGAHLTLISEKLICQNYRVCKGHLCKDVPIYVQLIDIN